MNRTKIIQALIDKFSLKSYLEIGVQTGLNFNAIRCAHKTGVDPDRKSKATIFQTSDLYFSINSNKFDIIFIDGMHTAVQVERDILNSMKILNPGGFIVCHDMNPENELVQKVPRVSKVWTGDCWKALVKLRTVLTGWDFTTIDCDFGVSIIRRDPLVRKGLHAPEITWDNFNANRKKWLNLISVNEFQQSI